MKLVILHGGGFSAILNKISSIKKDFDASSTMLINGKEVSFNQAILTLSTPLLFSNKRLAILENFEDTIQLEKLPNDEELLVVIKFPKALNANSLLLKIAYKLKAQVIIFNEEKEISIFPFLDCLTSRDPKALIFLDKLLNEYGCQYILTMLFYMFRRLVVSPKNISSYNLTKLEKGRMNFPIEKIKYFYQEILKTDFKIKSGLISDKQALISLTFRVLS